MKRQAKATIDGVTFLCEQPGIWTDLDKRVVIESGRKGWLWKWSGGVLVDEKIRPTMTAAMAAAVAHMKAAD